jgi:uncharacterized membrane protein
MQNQKGSVVWWIIIVVIIALAIYFYGLPGINTNYGSPATTEELSTQGESDDIEEIEVDLNDTELENLDAELSDIEGELQSL